MPGELQIPNWEWWIVVYFFVGGIAGGAYFTSAIIELVGRPADRPIARMGYYIAFPLSLVSAVALIADLGRPERFWHMIVYSKTFVPDPKWDSPISVGAYALLFFGGFSFLSFLDALVETGRLPWAPHTPASCWLTLICRRGQTHPCSARSSSPPGPPPAWRPSPSVWR
jgi:formate-dependent nitrite reductase membrane component NrfD